MLTLGETASTCRLEATLESDTNVSLPSHVTPQLPLELLQRAFLALADLYYGEYNPSFGRPIWIEITYVCRYWRSAALYLRELWSSITPDLSITWSQAMVKRSAPLPMTIIIIVNDVRVPVQPYGVNSLAALELLSTSEPRIRTLGLQGRPADVLNVLNRLCRPSPLGLLRLSLLNRGGPVDIPESLYGGDAPHLRRLTIDSDACIRMPLWLLSNITHFTNNRCVSLDHLLEALQAMPQLEVLCIVRLWDCPDSADLDNLPRLPRTNSGKTSPR